MGDNPGGEPVTCLWGSWRHMGKGLCDRHIEVCGAPRRKTFLCRVNHPFTLIGQHDCKLTPVVRAKCRPEVA